MSTAAGMMVVMAIAAVFGVLLAKAVMWWDDRKFKR